MPMIPSTSAIAPAIPSITSVKEVRASELIVDFLHRPYEASGRLGIHRPHGLPHLVEKAFGPGAIAADHEGHRAHGVRGMGPNQAAHHRRPVDDSGRFLIHAVLTDILYDADHFLPRHVRKLAEAFAERGRGRAPQLAREILGNDRHRPEAVNFGPREFASRNQSCAAECEKIRARHT